jgi:hypothetical protein
LFGADALLPHQTIPFLLSWASSVLIEGWSTTDIIRQLLTSSALGQHTPIILIAGSPAPNDGWTINTRRFLWSNSTVRPHGHFLPLLCPECGSYRSLELLGRRDQVGDLTFICKTKRSAENGGACYYKSTFQRFSGLAEMQRPPMDVWLVENLALDL